MDKAAQAAEQAVAALPENSDALSMRGSIELFQNRADGAYGDFAAAAKLSPQASQLAFPSFMALVDLWR